MNDFITKIFPIILIFFLGFILKLLKLFSKEDGNIFLKVVFYVSLPVLAFQSVAQTKLVTSYFFLPFLAIFIVGITFCVAYFIGRKINLERRTFGTFLIGSMIMNTGFTMPFVIAAFGSKGLAIYTFFDLGNCLLIFTFIYYFAIKFGNNQQSKIPFKKFLLLPPIWGLLLGIIFNFSGFTINPLTNSILTTIGSPTVFLMMLSLGLYFNPHLNNLLKIALVLFVRIGIGFLVGISLVTVFKFTGIVRTLVILFSAAPVGYNTLIFSTLEKLDEEFAASIVSISLLLGIIYIPFILFFF